MKKYDRWTLKYETNQPQGIKIKEILTYNYNWISKFGNDTEASKDLASDAGESLSSSSGCTTCTVVSTQR